MAQACSSTWTTAVASRTAGCAKQRQVLAKAARSTAPVSRTHSALLKKCNTFSAAQTYSGNRLAARQPTSATPASARRLQVNALTISEEVVMIDTPTGPMHTLVLKPTAPGTYPGIVFYSEIFQVTGPIRRSAAMMACHGFMVIVPDIYHENQAPGSSLHYDDRGADLGNELKINKPMDAYDTDADAAVRYLQNHYDCTGKVGTMGFCIGGHLAFRAALHRGVVAAAVFYPTDIHKGSPAYLKKSRSNEGWPSVEKGGSMGSTCNTFHRIGELACDGTELLMIFGRQDPHIDRAGRQRILNGLMDHDVCFSWHEFNGQHAFMRDEGYRYDGELAIEAYQKAVNLFRRKLHSGDLPVPVSAACDVPSESRH